MGPLGTGSRADALGRHDNELVKRDHPSSRLVPQRQAHTDEAVAERDASDALQLGAIAQNPVEAIVWDPAAEVVDVVQADVGRELAQNHRCRAGRDFPSWRDARHGCGANDRRV